MHDEDVGYMVINCDDLCHSDFTLLSKKLRTAETLDKTVVGH